MSQHSLAAVMTAPYEPIVVREFAVPDLPEGAALLRTACSEVCGTDVRLWHGRLSGVPYPIIPGHVSAGMLDRVRGKVRGLDGGRYVVAGHYTDVGPRAVNAHHDINRKHLEIRGCWGSEPDHFLRALALLARHAAHVPWDRIGAR